MSERRRPKHLFTGLVKCGCYGGEAAKAQIRKTDRELNTLLDLILKGGAAGRIYDKMVALEQRKKDIATMLETAEEPPALDEQVVCHGETALLQIAQCRVEELNRTAIRRCDQQFIC
ncbi:hypothetical protein [Rhizobium sp. GR12]|uniref:hypothetical protein n=1 Tax=Rhizobium sp. GR12 TaxID=3053925 RepID=UPI002FBE2646